MRRLNNVLRKIVRAVRMAGIVSFKTAPAAIRFMVLQAAWYMARPIPAVRRILSAKTFVFEMKNAVFCLRCAPGDLGVIFDVFIDHIYERFPEFVPQDGWVCMDAGANIGACTARWRLANPSGPIIAVEPHPVTFAQLQTMVRLNGWSNVKCLQAALSARNCEVRIGMRPDSNMAIVNDTGESVRGVRLDDLCGEFGLNRIDLCKIDVEGHEIEVLTGAHRLFPRIVRLIIEYHSFPLRQEINELLSPYFDIKHEDERRIGLVWAVNKDLIGPEGREAFFVVS